MMKYGLFIALAIPFVLAGCSSTKDSLGLTKKAPDEFAVIKRAPLSMPPDYTLRPPMPGVARPQEQSTGKAARIAVFGQDPEPTSEATSADDAFLTQAGADIADPDIRTKIKAEQKKFEKDNRPIGQKIFGIGSSDSGNVVDAKAEAQRILGNTEKGDPVTLGETPMK